MRHVNSNCVILFAMVLLISAFALPMSSGARADSPPMTPWLDQLPIPPVATPGVNPGYPGADYYEITETQHTHRFHSQLGLALVRTYGEKGKMGVYAGPTIIANTNKPVVVKYTNLLPTGSFPLPGAIDPTIDGGDLPTGRAIPHLHGGHNAAQFDGTPNQWWTAGFHQTGPAYQTDTFVYANDQPASLLWYHDHAMGITRHNPYLGLAAAYLLVDGFDTGTAINGQKTPSGPYMVPLVIQDKTFNADGSLFYPTSGATPIHPVWVPEFFGDTPVINGKAYPFMNAQPRRYRFRLLNGSNARFYNLKLSLGPANLPFWVIGSDGGLLPTATQVQNLLIAPGERYDIIADFSKLRLGTFITLTNDAPAPYPGGGDVPVPVLMQIRINTAVPAGDPDTTAVPQSLKLLPNPRLAPPAHYVPRDIVLRESEDPVTGEPVEVLLNGYHFGDPVTDLIKNGSTEVWQFINLTGDAHPMHLHLVQFQVLNRQWYDGAAYAAAWDAYLISGRNPRLKPDVRSYLWGESMTAPLEERGWKDTVKCYPDQITRVVAKFTLPPTSVFNPVTGSFGDYVYHCHILEHEENDMMRPFTVVP